MSGTVILLAVIVVMYLLGKYAIEEGQRVERQKKMLEDIKKGGNKNNK